jgi:hypothetical protein
MTSVALFGDPASSVIVKLPSVKFAGMLDT